MGKYRIFTVGFDLPGDEFEYIQVDSDQTLLDADIILFEPSLSPFHPSERYNGRPLLTESLSFQAKASVDHWKSEIVDAVGAGKLVIVYLTKPDQYFRYTGESQYSGSGRSRQKTNLVTEISSYDALPNITFVKAKSGEVTRLDATAKYLSSYWKEFSEYHPYEVEIKGEFTKVIITSKAGGRIVGAAVHSKGPGRLLLLPCLRYPEEDFVLEVEEEDSDLKMFSPPSYVWTEEALKFGKRLVAALCAMADGIRYASQRTPPPDWTLNSDYRMAKESELEVAITRCDEKIAELQTQRTQFQVGLSEAGTLRRLLFEQGEPLEKAVIEALRQLGFSAEPFVDAESEFDAVFVSPEGRCLGEAEGKDNKSVSIEKFSQLERNLQEDFAREEVTEYAKGVLFGNAYRLLPMDERKAFFTDKCMSAAQRVGAALVRTPDLFAPAKYMKENPMDTEYALKCRRAVFRAKGILVKFPKPPSGPKTVIAESPKIPDGESTQS